MSEKRYKPLREKIGRLFYQRFVALSQVFETEKDLVTNIDGENVYIPFTEKEKIAWAAMERFAMAKIAAKAKTIFFSSEQGQVFTGVHESYVDSLDYKLPFSDVIIQFDSPVAIEYKKRFDTDYDRGRLIAAGLHQEEVTKAEWLKRIDSGVSFAGISPTDGEYMEKITGDTLVSNQICFLYEDWGTEYINWIGGNTQEWLASTDDIRKTAMQTWKNVIIACIGYINCENVYLHREGVVADSINAKRERKGKSKLEPYYVCRIRGVQYNSDGSEKGTGSKQSIRYDVRGHFRRYENGKTTWVRAHQRGLQNELYVPKTYLVDKKAQA